MPLFLHKSLHGKCLAPERIGNCSVSFPTDDVSRIGFHCYVVAVTMHGVGVLCRLVADSVSMIVLALTGMPEGAALLVRAEAAEALCMCIGDFFGETLWFRCPPDDASACLCGAPCPSHRRQSQLRLCRH